jgi:hypothetical protein
MSTPTEAEIQDLKRELTKGEWIHLQLDPCTAFSLIGILQLACRHPDFVGSTRVLAEQLARDLQEKVAMGRPKAAAAMERGWDKFFDA